MKSKIALSPINFCTSVSLKGHSSVFSIVTPLWAVRSGVRIPAGARNFSLHEHMTISGAHPAPYSVGVRGNLPRVGAGILAAEWCWELDVPSSEVKNKWIYTSTPLTLSFFVDRDNFTITACFAVNSVRSLICIDSGVLLKFYDFVYPCSKPLAEKLTQWNLDFIFLGGPFKMNVKSTEWKFTCVIHLNEYCTALNMESSSTQCLKNAI